MLLILQFEILFLILCQLEFSIPCKCLNVNQSINQNQTVCKGITDLYASG